MGHHRGKLVASTNSEYESRIQAALVGVTNSTYKNITVAARVHQVTQQTLNDQSKGLHMSHGDFAKSQQLLQPSEDEAVKDWLAHESFNLVNEISGRLASKHWHHRYLARHKKSISTHKPQNLNLKCAQNFNKTTVEGYFTLRGKLDKKYDGIPAVHNWNMDEKGNQMGGSWNCDGSKFIFATDSEDHNFYHQHSNNLEPVMILECANAAGATMSPYFVLKEGPLPDGTDSRLDITNHES
ncbi:hypothetical protein DFH29DRAFT_881361 [Suillus ampliporus]|nr:hypothetical protein DFH29DRAFT_881361 [Suillus ampliporus]